MPDTEAAHDRKMRLQFKFKLKGNFGYKTHASYSKATSEAKFVLWFTTTL